MPLHIYFDGIDDVSHLPVSESPEALFYRHGIDVTEVADKLVHEIDKGKLLTSKNFLNKFEYYSYTSWLSTGCKAALFVHKFPNLVIDCREAGNNAIASIIRNCTEGAILIGNRKIGLGRNVEPIDVIYRGVHFTSQLALSQYIWPKVPVVSEKHSLNTRYDKKPGSTTGLYYDYRRYVRVMLDPGVYVTIPLSCTGKSYLADYLLTLHRLGERVMRYRPGDGTTVEQVLDRSKYDLVLLDRYDTYKTVAHSEIEEFGKTGIVIIDCKTPEFEFEYKYCALGFTEKGFSIV